MRKKKSKRPRKKGRTEPSCKQKPEPKAQESNEEHAEPLNELEEHECFSDTTEGGRCLRYHNEAGRYTKITCSYRWQAHEIAKTRDDHIFNRDITSGSRIRTSAYETEEGGLFPSSAQYAASIARPLYKGDWALDGPKRGSQGKLPMQRARRVIPDGQNFTKWVWPYWHNSHHLIPKSLFWNGVNGGFDENPVPEIFKLMRQSLFKAKYNIHHGDNVLILPMDEEVGRMLGLPRHLGLGKGSKLSHQLYDDKVKLRLKSVIDGYKGICDEAIEDHDIPEATLDKQKLIDLSEDCYNTILDFAAVSPGQALDEIDAISAT